MDDSITISNLIKISTALITIFLIAWYWYYIKNQNDIKASRIDKRNKISSVSNKSTILVEPDVTAAQRNSEIKSKGKNKSKFYDEIYKVTQQDLKEANELVSDLYNKSKGKKSRLVKRSEFVHQPSGIPVFSWRMNEWDYKKHRTPTQARGLFTRENNGIVIRGYDKFFNVDEVSETKWENIVTRTKGPYEVTVKENGCIIFISGLSEDSIIVTSKNSMGERGDGVSHAVVGEQWLDRHLEKVGKTKQDLAKFLYKYKLTAVAELCDDQFEEHVLPYEVNRRGLHLHGVNYNMVNLKTWPNKMVAKFAKEWGFIKTGCYIKQTVEEVKIFADDIKKKGLLDDRPIEGFVIRTKIVSTEQDFFFKIKYDEPYLMYREWRELTKALLSNRKNLRVTYELSHKYLEWVKEKINTHPKMFEGYKQNHGIFHVREMFLEYLNNKGDTQTVEKIPQEEIKTLLVPVATIGCGKTTLSLALGKLFSFAHIQNDNIVGKKARIEFHRTINEKLESHDVVIADRNNHTRELRKTLIESVKKSSFNVRIVAIYWNHEDRINNEIFQITSKRVVARGGNHQSLTPENPNYEGIMWGFLKDFEPLDSNNHVDYQFDYVIDLDVANDAKTNLEIIINELKSVIGIEKPGEDEIEKVLEEVKYYKPVVRKNVSNNKRVSYYGIGLDLNVQDFLTKYYDEHPDKDSETFKRLVQMNRIGPIHHTTLIHIKQLKIDPSDDKQELWNQCKELCNDPPQVKVYINKIVFDSQIMALVISKIDPPTIRTANKIAHITVGTINDSIKNFQANTICESALLGNHGGGGDQFGISVINLDQELEVNGDIKAYY